jgi:concanavalin A-like lectin/glucanase superfamily protein
MKLLTGHAKVCTRLMPCISALVLLSSKAAPATTYPSTILSDHPVAYYRLEELSGATTAVDSSANGLDATYMPNSTSVYPKLGLPGIDTNSILVNGGADFGWVRIPYNILLSPTNSDGVTGAPFSAECWAQATSESLADYTSPLAMSGAYSGAHSANATGWNFYQTLGPASTWALYIRGGAVYPIPSPIKITLLQWYHLAVTWDGTNATFYVDGVSQGSSKIVYDAVDPSVGYDGAIGAGPQTGHGAFAGGVDEVAFYTNALGADRILAHYEVGTNSFRAAPSGPGFVSLPASITNYSGTTVKFSTVASGTPPLHYLWKKNGAAISGATSSIYSFVCAYPADDGAGFSVTVTNSIGSTNSPMASLSVLTNLNILHDPFGPITRNVGSKAAFRVAANGALPITYQWFKGSTVLSGASNDTLWLNNIQNSDAANYHAHVTGPFGAADSADAALFMQARSVTVPLTGYARVVVADDPVAYYRLDETSGSSTAVDAVGSFDGTYDTSLGGITFGIPTGIPHETDTAIDLSDTNTASAGKGGVVRIPYALELNPYGAWSAEAWVRPDSNDTNGNFRTVLSSLYNFNFSAAVYGWAIYQHPNGGSGAWTLVVFNGGGGPSFFGSDFGHIPLIPGSWYHLVLTDDGATIQLYVNGVAGSANTSITGFIPNGVNGDPTLQASPEVLGQRSDGAYNGFSGAVDDVAFYNHALTPQQVTAHFANSTRLSVVQYGKNLVLTWPFGTLQSASSVIGTYGNVNGANSPYTNAVSGSTTFFRLKLQ